MALHASGFAFPVAKARLLVPRPPDSPPRPTARLCTLSGSTTNAARHALGLTSLRRIRWQSKARGFCAASASSGQEGSSQDGDRGSAGADGDGDAEANADADADADLSRGLGDWREFRARLVQAGEVPLVPESEAGANSSAEPPQDSAGAATERLETDKMGSASSWAHAIAAPEQGCLVIAHPAAFGVSQQYFNQAVIFLFTHGNDGSAGVILNRPSQYCLGQVAGLDEFVPEFSAAPLYMGGDVGPTSLLCIHGVEDLSRTHGAQPICSGIFLGGSQGAKEHIRSGKSKAWDYRWFARYAGWAPGQLQREVEAGYWFLAASSSDLVLKHCVALDKPLWREVMELMGGEHKLLADTTYGE